MTAEGVFVIGSCTEGGVFFFVAWRTGGER